MITRSPLMILTLTGFLLLITGVSASAVTTLGAVDPGTPAGGMCQHELHAQVTTAVGQSSYVAAADGVVVKFRHKAQVGSQQKARFFVLEPSTAPNLLVRSYSDQVDLTASALNTFDVRMSIEAGDTIGIYNTENTIMGPGIACTYSSANADDDNAYILSALPPAVGATFDTSVNPLDSTLLNLEADVEADYDNDGYGDESQDTCATNKYTHTKPCCPKGSSARVLCTARGLGFVEAGSSLRDVMVGTSVKDIFNGGRGNDRIFAKNGRDVVNAGRGHDQIFAGDNKRDSINCGRGRDTVWADRNLDQLRYCEVVHWIG